MKVLKFVAPLALFVVLMSGTAHAQTRAVRRPTRSSPWGRHVSSQGGWLPPGHADSRRRHHCVHAARPRRPAPSSRRRARHAGSVQSSWVAAPCYRGGWLPPGMPIPNDGGDSSAAARGIRGRQVQPVVMLDAGSVRVDGWGHLLRRWVAATGDGACGWRRGTRRVAEHDGAIHRAAPARDGVERRAAARAPVEPASRRRHRRQVRHRSHRDLDGEDDARRRHAERGREEHVLGPRRSAGALQGARSSRRPGEPGTRTSRRSSATGRRTARDT